MCCAYIHTLQDPTSSLVTRKLRLWSERSPSPSFHSCWAWLGDDDDDMSLPQVDSLSYHLRRTRNI